MEMTRCLRRSSIWWRVMSLLSVSVVREMITAAITAPEAENRKSSRSDAMIFRFMRPRLSF